MAVYSYNGEGNLPEFERIQKIDTLSDELDILHDAAEALAISPDGKYLFSSTAGDNSVAMFSIDPQNGMLTKKFALPISGEYPKALGLFPDGKHIASVNHESNSITTFTIDYEKNVLVMRCV